MSDSVTVFEIGGQKFDVVKKGFAQANQVAAISRWLGKHGAAAIRNLNNDMDVASAGGIELITGLLGNLDGYALLDLFTLVFGCSQKLAEEYFDISLLIDGGVALFENQPAFKRVIDRFFSTPASQDPTDITSTQSE